MTSGGATDVAGDNISQYWKGVLGAHPELLWQRSNDELYRIYLTDHPGESTVPKNVTQGLSNVKSILRKRDAKKGKGRKGRRKARAAAENGAAAPAPARAARTPARGLQQLEEHIDDCLNLAKNLGQESLEPVIQALRRVRNQVIFQQGP